MRLVVPAIRKQYVYQADNRNEKCNLANDHEGFATKQPSHRNYDSKKDFDVTLLYSKIVA